MLVRWGLPACFSPLWGEVVVRFRQGGEVEFLSERSPMAAGFRLPYVLPSWRMGWEEQSWPLAVAAGVLLINSLSIFPECSLDTTRWWQRHDLYPPPSLGPHGNFIFHSPSFFPFCTAELQDSPFFPPARCGPNSPKWRTMTRILVRGEKFQVGPLSKSSDKVLVSFLTFS
jgi:hypothetical protein